MSCFPDYEERVLQGSLRGTQAVYKISMESILLAYDIPHPLGALATTPKIMETTYKNPYRLQTMHCFSSTHRMAPPHRYASFPSIPNQDHHLPKVNRLYSCSASIKTMLQRQYVLPVFIKKKQGKIMAPPRAPTKKLNTSNHQPYSLIYFRN